MLVFLDDGANVPGSSNSGIPYPVSGADVSWDVTATAESGLSDIGAAVMEVRMVTLNVAGDSRGMSPSVFGLGIQTGGNGAWMDGSTRETAVFQLAFYSDLAKTLEITDVDITFVTSLL